MIEALQAAFVRQLPNLRSLAASQFSELDREARAEAIQNTMALAWKQFRRLAKRGKDAAKLAKSCVWYAAKQTRMGRLPQRCPNAKDVVESRKLERVSLRDYESHKAAIPDIVSFRIDTPEFFGTLTERQRSIALDLAAGLSTSKVARKHGVTAAAISQFRQRFKVMHDRYFNGAA